MSKDLETLQNLERDIALIKKAIRSNNSVIRSIIGAPNLSAFFFSFGLALLFIPLAWDFLINRYGGVRVIPTSLLVVLLVSTVGIFVVLSLWKIKAVERAARNVDPNYRWIDTVESLMEHPVFLHQLLVMLFTIFASVLAFQRSAYDFIVPIIALGLATVFMLYAAVFLFTEYSALTFYLYLFSAFALIFPIFSPLVMASIGFRGGFMVFGIAVHDFKGRNKQA